MLESSMCPFVSPPPMPCSASSVVDGSPRSIFLGPAMVPSYVHGSQTLLRIALFLRVFLTTQHRLRGCAQAALLTLFFVSSSSDVRTWWQALGLVHQCRIHVRVTNSRVRWLNHSTHAGTALHGLAAKTGQHSRHDHSISDGRAAPSVNSAGLDQRRRMLCCQTASTLRTTTA